MENSLRVLFSTRSKDIIERSKDIIMSLHLKYIQIIKNVKVSDKKIDLPNLQLLFAQLVDTRGSILTCSWRSISTSLGRDVRLHLHFQLPERSLLY